MSNSTSLFSNLPLIVSFSKKHLAPQNQLFHWEDDVIIEKIHLFQEYIFSTVPKINETLTAHYYQ